MKIITVAGMVNTQNFFRPLVEELRKRGHGVDIFEGADPNDLSRSKLDEAMNEADFVLSGMAAPEEFADLEHHIIRRALAAGIPFGLLSDAAGAYKRPWFSKYAKKAALIAVRFPHEVEEAKALFPQAAIVAVGHPTAETFLNPPMSSLDVHKRLGVGEGEFVIYLGGAKSIQTNRGAIGLVDKAIKLMGGSCRFFLGRHPGVTGERARAAGKEISDSEYRALSARLEFTPADLKAEAVASGVNAFLFTSGTSFYSVVYGGDQNTPALLLNTPGLATVRDTDLSYECSTGAVIPVNSAEALANALNLSSGIATGDFRAMIAANRRVYWPKPEKGAAVETLADLVLNTLGARATENGK